VPELMAEARAEQALIAAQLRALKGTEGSEAFSPYSPATGSLRSAPGSPRNGGNHRDMSPGLEGSVMGSPVGGEELSALRAHVAELDHELVQRDCAIEELQGKLKQVSEALEKALLSPAEGGLWKDRYQTAQKESELRTREVKELKLKMEVKEKEIKLLSQYVRKLEEEARVRDGQRERLLTDASVARSKFKQTESEQQQLVSRLHRLEDAFARCVGRVTQALTAGVVGVAVVADTEDVPAPRFVVLTARPNTAILEVFEEPDANWELVAVELTPNGDLPPVSLDETMLSLIISGVFSIHGTEVTDVKHLAIKCPDKASFMKWSLAFRDVLGITDVMAHELPVRDDPVDSSVSTPQPEPTKDEAPVSDSTSS